MSAVFHWLLPSSSLSSLLTLAIRFVAALAIAFFWPKVKTLIAHALLSRYARYVVPFVQRLYPTISGAMRMDKAKALVDTWLRRYHVPLSAQEIEAAIEAAWNEYQAKGALSVYKAKKAAPTKAPAQPEVQTPPSASPPAPAADPAPAPAPAESKKPAKATPAAPAAPVASPAAPVTPSTFGAPATPSTGGTPATPPTT